jgi:L-amino acid N-acyltransferase YncA
VLVRDATEADADACAAIYAPYVRDTAISFEQSPPTPAELAPRIAAAHVWLVAEVDREVVGYAYGGAFKARAAYQWSCEVSVYVDRTRHRGGVARALYLALFDRLAARGYRTAVAGVTLPNEASEAFHKALGFDWVGCYHRIGWKHGAWHDVAQYQRPLGPGTDQPPD